MNRIAKLFLLFMLLSTSAYADGLDLEAEDVIDTSQENMPEYVLLDDGYSPVTELIFSAELYCGIKSVERNGQEYVLTLITCDEAWRILE